MAAEKRLTAIQVKNAGVGRHADGGGLYLVVGEDRRRWVWRYTFHGSARDMGLGSADTVTLAQARAERDKWRAVLASGSDPIEARKRRPEAVPTFSEALTRYVGEQLTLKRENTRAKWLRMVETHAGKLSSRPVDQIATADIVAVLKPIWQSTNATARILRARIEAILDAERALGHIAEDRSNPARWRGHLDKLMPRVRSAEHRPAMPYPEVPAFVRRLREADYVGARALEFCILTATRSEETAKAEWVEIDHDAKVWTIPASRMKGGRAHRVPLTHRCLDILAEVRTLHKGRFLFPGLAPRYPIAERTMRAVMERMGVAYTVHGFRSSFRDWAGDATSYPREIAEAALAHVAGDATEQAYRRGDALERRRALMSLWGQFLDGEHGGNVIQFASG